VKPLRAFTTTLLPKGCRGTRLIVVSKGKNVKDWAIRSQAPKLVMTEHGEGPESRRSWVLNDGLVTLIMLKVYSDLTINGKEKLAGNEFTYVSGPGVGVRINKFGRSAIPDNKSKQQRADNRDIPGFNGR
jgi:hypothetical protein